MTGKLKLEFVFDNDNAQAKFGDPEDQEYINPNQTNIFDYSTPPVTTPTRRRTRSATRRSVATGFSDVEFNEPKRTRRKAAGPKVNYVKPMKKKKRKAASTKFEWSWGKLAWMICGILVLRLFFMEGGVIDYHNMDKTLIEKQKDLERLRIENAELIKEIHRLKTSPSYQKKVAREHLGVIAKDEYLVLFANESIPE